MRKGAVLLVVLLFMFAISLLLMQSMGFTQKAYHDANRIRFMTQTNLLLNSLRGVLDKFLSQVSSAEQLFVLKNMPFFFEEKESGISFSITFESGATKLNINSVLDKNETIRELYYDVFENLLSKYNVIDKRFFFSLLLDSIDKDKEEREYSSELALINEEFRDGGIANFEQFEMLLEHYEASRNDRAIYNIPWERLITFSGEKIDINSADSELLEALLDGNRVITYHIEREHYVSSLNDISLSDEEKRRLAALGVEVYVPIVHCSVDFSAFGDSVKANFLYDLKKKSVYDFEINY